MCEILATAELPCVVRPQARGVGNMCARAGGRGKGGHGPTCTHVASASPLAFGLGLRRRHLHKCRAALSHYSQNASSLSEFLIFLLFWTPNAFIAAPVRVIVGLALRDMTPFVPPMNFSELS